MNKIDFFKKSVSYILLHTKNSSYLALKLKIGLSIVNVSFSV